MIVVKGLNCYNLFLDLRKNFLSPRNLFKRMFWLIGLIFILQASFQWLFKPLIVFTTPFFDFDWLLILLSLLVIWLLAGKQKIDFNQ